VNFQIARIRLSSVGPEPARFDPLELDFLKPDQSGPADTVLYLPNTGGKTVLMRLLFSVLHPPIVERIGTEETAHHKKNLLGYILDRDTSHVVVEWRRVQEGSFTDDDVLVTGLVAEWRTGRRPADPKTEDLTRLWYTIRGPAKSAGIDRLEFEIEGTEGGRPLRRRLPLRHFQERLEELKRSSRAQVDVSLVPGPRDWVDHLDRLGLDRALFRYQGEMNHNEAGASAIARFREDRDFIKFFLDAVFDPGELSGLDREFEEVADKVRRFPEYERRLKFEQAASSELEPLVGLVAALKTARMQTERSRGEALVLLGSFALAEAETLLREQRSRQRSREQDAEARRLAAQADRSRDEWREFRRLGAILWKREMHSAHTAAALRAEHAELDVRAWSLTEDLARLAEANAQVQALDIAYAIETERMKPFQAARDEAAARLVRQLFAMSVLASQQEKEAKSRAADAKRRAGEVRKSQTDAQIEATKLDSAREVLEKRVSEVTAYRDRVVARGLLSAQDRTDEAHARETVAAATARAQIASIEKESDALQEELTGLADQDTAAMERIAEVREAHARLDGEIERAETERRSLCSEPAVVELAEAAEFDLELVGSAIAERLLCRARDADAARVDLELQAVEDRRAVRGLEETGFLPPPADVEVALQHLDSAGIVGASAGTRYVADAIARDRRAGVLANRSDLVGGIVLADAAEFPRARTVLEHASLAPAMIITVGHAVDLVAAEKSTASATTFVVPPSDAIWDRTAGIEERQRRKGRLDSVDEKQSELSRRASSSRGLAEALVRHATAYPSGWLAMRSAERQRFSAEIKKLDDERLQRATRRTEINQSMGRLRVSLREQNDRAHRAEERASELQRLLEDEASIAGSGAIIEHHRAEAQSWRSIADEAEHTAASADEESEREQSVARDHRATADRLTAEGDGISLAERIPFPSLEAAIRAADRAENVFELRATFAELDRRLRGETSASETAAKRDSAIEARDKLFRAISTHPVNIQERAAVLLVTPEGGDLAGRRDATEGARLDASKAHDAERKAYAEHRKSTEELEKIEEEMRTSRRRADIPSALAPRDRHHAALLAADARQAADNAQSQVALAERESNIAREQADEAKKLGDALKVLGTQLRMSLKLSGDAALPSTLPFGGDTDEANRAGLETSNRLTNAIDEERHAEQAWRQRDSAVRTLLAREEFNDLAASDQLYRRLTQSAPDVLARDAAELVIELRTCIGVLQSELATLDEDRKLATTSLARSVHKALSYLRLAETRSKMPAQLRDWSGESFLEIRFDKPPAEELDVRLRTFVVQVLDPKMERPTGSKLLMLALERAVGQFRVRILKPNEAFVPIRVPVAELSSPTFSNGQRATVATAMMLMFSELRRQSRSAARDASVGSLILDNPLGNANAGFLIEVQRRVAAAAGIQLIYTTGIADLNALRRFSNVIAMSNDGARRTMRRYVRTNPALLELLVPPEDRAGGRVSAQRVVAVDSHES